MDWIAAHFGSDELVATLVAIGLLAGLRRGIGRRRIRSND